MKDLYTYKGCNYKLYMWYHKVLLQFRFSSLSLHCSGWQVHHSKLQASKVLANYQCSLLPCEMWSVWDDNMAIHYSLELGASCRSMGRTYQKPNSGYFCSPQACSLTRKIYWKAAGGWPGLSTDWPAAALFGCVESRGGWSAGQGWVNDSRRTHFQNSFLMLFFHVIASVHHYLFCYNHKSKLLCSKLLWGRL